MRKKDIILGLVLAFILALFLSPFASQMPDGLEKVAEDKGFIEKAQTKPLFHAPFADYLWPGLENEKISISLAGVAGTCIVFIFGYCLASLLKKKSDASRLS